MQQEKKRGDEQEKNQAVLICGFADLYLLVGADVDDAEMVRLDGTVNFVTG